MEFNHKRESEIDTACFPFDTNPLSGTNEMTDKVAAVQSFVQGLLYA